MELDLDEGDDPQNAFPSPGDGVVLVEADEDEIWGSASLFADSQDPEPGFAGDQVQVAQLVPVPRGQPGAGVIIAAPTPTARAAANRNAGVQQLARMTAADFQSLPPASCLRVAGRVATALAAQLERTKSFKNQLRVAKRKVVRVTDKAEKKMRKTVTSLVSTLTLQTAGKTGKRLTCQSAFSLGLRRNLSNVACSSIGAVLLMDISGQKVARAEIKTGAAIICSMRMMCSSLMGHCRSLAKSEALPEAPTDAQIPRPLSLSFARGSPWCLTVVSLRSDATNSAIWKRQSLNVLEAEVLVVSDFAAVRSFQSEKAFTIKRCLYIGFIWPCFC